MQFGVVAMLTELLLATTGILSTSIGAGVYLTGALHDIERDEPLKELPSLGELFTGWIPRRAKVEPLYPPVLTKAQADAAFYGPPRKPVPAESRTQYEERARLASHARPSALTTRGEWYGHLAGEPLEDLIARLVGRSPSKVVQAKVWEDKGEDGYWVSWLWEGEHRRQEMFVSRREIAR